MCAYKVVANRITLFRLFRFVCCPSTPVHTSRAPSFPVYCLFRPLAARRKLFIFFCLWSSSQEEGVEESLAETRRADRDVTVKKKKVSDDATFIHSVRRFCFCACKKKTCLLGDGFAALRSFLAFFAPPCCMYVCRQRDTGFVAEGKGKGSRGAITLSWLCL